MTILDTSVAVKRAKSRRPINEVILSSYLLTDLIQLSL